MRDIKFHVNFNSLIPKTRLLVAVCGILVSCLATILFVAPSYFLSGNLDQEIIGVYSVAIYFLLPFAIGAVTALMLGFHQRTSDFVSAFCSLLSLVFSFIALGAIYPIKPGYTGTILIVFSPICIVMNLIGTTVSYEYLSKKYYLDLN